MLYLFGQLALHDSLFYHEDFACDDSAAGPTAGLAKAAPSAHPAEANRPRERSFQPADRPTPCQQPETGRL
ncbi:MAG: hypothetical protein ACRYG7_12155 [Janthinobacterium lividum]